MITAIPEKPLAGLTVSLICLTILYVPVFYSNYAYMDEAYQLWHNRDGSNYIHFFEQGRWLSGLLFNKIYTLTDSISDLKKIRIFSFFCWALFLLVFFRLGKRWQQLIGFSNTILAISGIYIACTLSVSIYIGWAACLQTGMATTAALWSGSLVFDQLITKRTWSLRTSIKMILSLLLGICALFMYQVSFGAFLIPFAFYFITKKSLAEAKPMLAGAFAYLIINSIYYALFLWSLKIGTSVASNRTSLSFDIPAKLGFFFGMPLSQAFSFNFLYNTHSILSQAFPFLMIALWITGYLGSGTSKASRKIIFICSFICFCMLTYLPLLLSRENFASYRTMFVFNLVVSILLIDSILSIIKSKRATIIISYLMIGSFAGIAYWNFRSNYINPLKQEFKLITGSFNTKYRPGTDTIYFLRPSKDAFLKSFGINSYKDEFGLSSVFKDWAPEPQMKQLIMQRTGSRSLAEKTIVVQPIDAGAFKTATKLPQKGRLFFDVASLLHPGAGR